MPLPPSPASRFGRQAAADPVGPRPRAHAPAGVSRKREGLQFGGGGEGSQGWKRALAGWLARAAWRRRRELRVPAALAALLGVVAVGHAANQGLAWVPLVAGASIGGAYALWGHRPVHRWLAVGGAGAGLWAAAAWWVGLGDPIVGGGLALGAPAAVIAWWRHHSPRTHVRVTGGSVLPFRWQRWQFRRQALRDIRRGMASWSVAAYWGKVPRGEIRAAIADFAGGSYLLQVELAPGYRSIDLEERRAASALGVADSCVRLVLDDEERAANVVLLEWWPTGVPVPGGDAEESDQEPAGQEPATGEQFDAETADRVRRLRSVADELGAEAISARELARRAGVPADWTSQQITSLARELGLRRVPGRGWGRLTVVSRRSA